MPARAASIVRVFYSTFSILLTLKRCIQIKKRVQIAFLDWSSQGRTDKESDCVGKGPISSFYRPLPHVMPLRSNCSKGAVSHGPRNDLGVVPEASTLSSTKGCTFDDGE